MHPAPSQQAYSIYVLRRKSGIVCGLFRELQRSEDDFSDCADDVFHYTVNSSRLRSASFHGRSATFRQSADDVDFDDDVDDLVYVADIADTNLLLVVVDGRRTVAASGATTRRQVVR